MHLSLCMDYEFLCFYSEIKLEGNEKENDVKTARKICTVYADSAIAVYCF